MRDVIPAIPTSPVRPKSEHSANARVHKCTACGAAENKSLEIKEESRAGRRSVAPPALLGQHAPGVVSLLLRTSHGRGV